MDFRLRKVRQKSKGADAVKQQDPSTDGVGNVYPIYFIGCQTLSSIIVQSRKIRHNLTQAELERLKKYGSIEFKSAGATRKR
jgi:hypothetical protein